MCGGRNRTTALSTNINEYSGENQTDSGYLPSEERRDPFVLEERSTAEEGLAPFDRGNLLLIERKGKGSLKKMGNACYLDTKRDRCDSLFVCVVKMRKERIAKAIREVSSRVTRKKMERESVIDSLSRRVASSNPFFPDALSWAHDGRGFSERRKS